MLQMLPPPRTMRRRGTNLPSQQRKRPQPQKPFLQHCQRLQRRGRWMPLQLKHPLLWRLPPLFPSPLPSPQRVSQRASPLRHRSSCPLPPLIKLLKLQTPLAPQHTFHFLPLLQQQQRRRGQQNLPPPRPPLTTSWRLYLRRWASATRSAPPSPSTSARRARTLHASAPRKSKRSCPRSARATSSRTSLRASQRRRSDSGRRSQSRRAPQQQRHAPPPLRKPLPPPRG